MGYVGAYGCAPVVEEADAQSVYEQLFGGDPSREFTTQMSDAIALGLTLEKDGRTVLDFDGDGKVTALRDLYQLWSVIKEWEQDSLAPDLEEYLEEHLEINTPTNRVIKEYAYVEEGPLERSTGAGSLEDGGVDKVLDSVVLNSPSEMAAWHLLDPAPQPSYAPVRGDQLAMSPAGSQEGVFYYPKIESGHAVAEDYITLGGMSYWTDNSLVDVDFSSLKALARNGEEEFAWASSATNTDGFYLDNDGGSTYYEDQPYGSLRALSIEDTHTIASNFAFDIPTMVLDWETVSGRLTSGWSDANVIGTGLSHPGI